MTFSTIFFAAVQDVILEWFFKSDSELLSCKLARIIDTLRIFVGCAEFSGDDSDCWMSLEALTSNLLFYDGDFRNAMSTILLWVLSQFSYDIRTNFDERHWARVLYWIDFVRSPDISCSFLRLGPDKAIDICLYRGGYSKLLGAIVEGKDLSCFLGLGPNLHLVGLDEVYSPYEESPTSLAMYSGGAFANWRTYLKRSEVDLGAFIMCELEQGPLGQRGWDFDALQRLFHWDFEQCYDILDCTHCCDCGVCPGVSCQMEGCGSAHVAYHFVQPYWLHQLEKIKSGVDPHDLCSAEVAGGKASSTNIGDSPFRRTIKTTRVGALRSQNEDNDVSASPESTKLTTGDDTEGSASESSGSSTTNMEFGYGRDEQVCMECWLHYQRTGLRYQDSPRTRYVEASLDTDESSEDDYSPFHIHT